MMNDSSVNWNNRQARAKECFRGGGGAVEFWIAGNFRNK